VPLVDIDAERDAIRSRLLAELSEPSRALLFRLSICSGSFDRDMVLAIGAAPPTLAMPGGLLDSLLGPWIEVRGRDRFWVSPLVANAGDKVMAPAEQVDVHRAIVGNLIRRNPFPGEQFSQLLVSSLWSRHEVGLRLLVGAVMSVGKEDYAQLARDLGALALFRLDTPIYDGSAELAALLRVAQLRVAILSERTNISAIIDCIFLETENVEGGADLRSAASGIALLADSTSLSPAEWFALLPKLDDEKQFSLPGNAAQGGGRSWTQRKFAFVLRATSLRSVEELVDLFATLDTFNTEQRSGYLNALMEPYAGVRALLQGPWVADSARDGFDPVATAERYTQLEHYGHAWGEPRIEIECAGCQAVLLSEHADDQEAALEILDRAIDKWPSEARLLRERSKILFRMGDYAGALERLSAIVDKIPQTDSVERTYVLREMAISAAETGDLNFASTLFAKAYEASTEAKTLSAMGAGLLGDLAVVRANSDFMPEALEALYQAVVASEASGPEGPRDEFVLRVLGHVSVWMLHLIDPKRAGGKTFEYVYGFCSRDPPDVEWPAAPVAREGLWYQMAEIESALGLDYGIAEQTCEHVSGEHIEGFEIARVFSPSKAIVRAGDTQKFCKELRPLCQAGQYLQDLKKSGRIPDLYERLPELPWSAIELDLSINPLARHIGMDALLAFIACSRLLHDSDPVPDLIETLSKQPLLGPLCEFLMREDELEDDATRLYQLVFKGLDQLTAKSMPGAAELYVTVFYLWKWLGDTPYRKELEVPIGRAVCTRWLWILDNATFSLCNPSHNGPKIRAACEQINDRIQIARLLLAAENAVNVNIPVSVKQEIRQACSVATDLS
jgi:tetratricopeptide (TPR) repeat protein